MLRNQELKNQLTVREHEPSRQENNTNNRLLVLDFGLRNRIQHIRPVLGGEKLQKMRTISPESYYQGNELQGRGLART
jgi:hypothetical protein